ncbi:MAG: hypothetical protein J2P31_03420 [Blastocatellia bacterium]|nr:hypothetical protein [Blastocatellia bacterium]
MLNQDFKEMLSCLNEEQVEYIVVGAYALAAHGYVRATGDIDIWVHNDKVNAGRVISALRKFGAPVLNLSEADLLAPDLVVQIGVAPCRVDIITGIDAVDFKEAWAHKISVSVDEIKFHVLSKPDLLKNKLATGRDRDQGDIAWLKKNP